VDDADCRGPETREQSRLGELFQRHAADGVRLAYLITGNRALAEDLVQDAFVRLAGRLVRLSDPGNLEPYLRRTIVVDLYEVEFDLRIGPR
jgi:DNA-directed RNA polymerase specialized sigma24 family protein